MSSIGSSSPTTTTTKITTSPCFLRLLFLVPVSDTRLDELKRSFEQCLRVQLVNERRSPVHHDDDDDPDDYYEYTATYDVCGLSPHEAQSLYNSYLQLPEKINTYMHAAYPPPLFAWGLQVSLSSISNINKYIHFTFQSHSFFFLLVVIII
jgi:hypothetical protein